MEEIIKINCLSDSQRREVNDLCNLVFANHRSHVFDDTVHIVAIENEKIISHAAWAPRWIRFKQVLLKTAYVKKVVTHPDFRNKGLATRVMKRLFDEVNNDGYNIGALLATCSNFYEKSDWKKWNGKFFIRKEEKFILHERDNVMVLNLNVPELDYISDLYIRSEAIL